MEGVTLLDMTGAGPRPDMTVVVTGSRIAAVGKTGQVTLPEGSRRVDGRGRFLIPGLWDMHVHVLYEPYLDVVFPLLVANGVTGVRDMNTAMPLEEVEVLRREIDRGERLGPRILTPGPLVDGSGRSARARGPNTVVVTSPQEAREAVRSLAARGADFIKVYHHLTPELFDAIVEEAGRQGLPVFGHVPYLVGPEAAAEAGMRTMEHLTGVLEAVSTAGPAYRRLLAEGLARIAADPEYRPGPELVEAIYTAREALADGYDPELAAHLIQTFVDNGTWQCPTLVSNRTLFLSGLGGESDRRRAEDPRLAYLPASFRESWSGPGTPYMRDPEARRRTYGKLLTLVGEMHRAGVRFLAGTDTGVPHVFPGFSLHDELELLVEAGLTPAAALAAATRGPAEVLGLSASLGTVEEGKRADLVLLAADPLQDIRNTRRIEGVFLAGRYLDREALDQLLARARELAPER